MQRNPIESLGILALMATHPLIANAQLMADGLFSGNELATLRAEQEASGHPNAADGRREPQSEEPKRGLLERLDQWFWRLEQRALEQRLAGATDVYDLEVRIREIERGTARWSH